MATNTNIKDYNVVLMEKGSYGLIYKAILPGVTHTIMKVNILSEFCDFNGNIKELDLLAKLANNPLFVRMIRPVFADVDLSAKTREKLYDEKHLTKGSKYDNVIFELEYVPQSLATASRKRSGFSDKEFYSNFKSILLQCIIGLDVMCMNGVCHRDIKPENILLSKNTPESMANYDVSYHGLIGKLGKYIVKICDFGMSDHHSTLSKSNFDIVTWWYRAPEIVIKDSYNDAIDIWALGATFVYLCNKSQYLRQYSDSPLVILRAMIKNIPWANQNDVDFLLSNKGYRSDDFSADFIDKLRDNLTAALETKKVLTPEQFVGVSNLKDGDHFVDLMKGMMAINPGNRFTITDCLNHPYFQDESSLGIIEEYVKVRACASNIRIFEPIGHATNKLANIIVTHRDKFEEIILDRIKDDVDTVIYFHTIEILMRLAINDEIIDTADSDEIVLIDDIIEMVHYLAMKSIEDECEIDRFDVDKVSLKNVGNIETKILGDCLGCIVHVETPYEKYNNNHADMNGEMALKLLRIFIGFYFEGDSFSSKDVVNNFLSL